MQCKEKAVQRLDHYSASPEAMRALIGLEIAVERLGLGTSLVCLIKMRVSQINGCSFCADLHYRDALASGEPLYRLHALADWRHHDCFTERERAAFTWTESLALLPATGAPDADYAVMAAQFSPAEQVALTMAINLGIAWNQFGVGFRKSPVQ